MISALKYTIHIYSGFATSPVVKIPLLAISHASGCPTQSFPQSIWTPPEVIPPENMRIHVGKNSMHSNFNSTALSRTTGMNFTCRICWTTLKLLTQFDCFGLGLN